jgi:nucleotide-binding universal stress UspA family protein
VSRERPELAYLHDLAARLRGPAPGSTSCRIASGQYDRPLCRRPGDTIVVVGTHGRSGLRDLIMGSVARGVAHQASCPVLVVSRRAGHKIA